LFRGVFGILLGAGLYSEVYPLIQNNFLTLGDYGKLTLPTLLGVNPWVIIVPFAVVVAAILLWMDKLDKQRVSVRRN
jgi:hypothetical protein